MAQKTFSNSKLNLARILMIAAILLIVAFQGYWLRKLYRDERAGLAKETNTIFRETVYNLQVDRLKNDTSFYHTLNRPNLFVYNAMNVVRNKVAEIKRDSAKAARKKDSATRVIILGDPKKIDTGDKRPRIVIRSDDGNIPPEMLREMIRKQMDDAAERNSKDSITWKRSAGAGAGVTMVFRQGPPPPGDSIPRRPGRNDILIERKLKPGSRKDSVVPGTSLRFQIEGDHPENAFVRMITDGKLISDTIAVGKLDSAYQKELAKNNIKLDFKVLMGKGEAPKPKDTAITYTLTTRPATVGLANPHWYTAEFVNPTVFLLRKITPQILFSVFLVAFTMVTFIFLYRNLAAQRRLTEMKNDFISNITHELKTPIATVSVAVEALRNFGGMQSPERTKEYLDISASELQRLGLLVDKVLKLSMFENRELELKKEQIDLKGLLEEVLNTMKLQFEKSRATLHIDIQGQYFLINADRLHITSVIYNLLDNALKYSKDKPDITVQLKHDTDFVVLSVADKGIGIPAGFTSKIFEKFFRVPTGDHHNIKGYGLGLSYVSHVLHRHGGSIGVESEPGKGSTFTVKLPIA